jgi:hypothetical protein
MRTVVVLSISAALACSTATSTPITEVVGTWGGDNAGLIVSATDVHVHIGCTLGDALGPIRPDADGRFASTGTYNVDAFPVDRGIVHPATFTGQIVGLTMTLTVSLTDTARVLGPVTLIYGKEPKMGPCPICRVPKKMTLRRQPGIRSPSFFSALESHVGFEIP